MKIIIAASGTGGHLIPALTIADELKEKSEVVFIGSGRPLEDKIVTEYKKYNTKIVGVKNRGIFGKFQFLLYMPIAIFQVIRIFLREKPDYVLGVGGYVSVFPVLIAKLFGIRTGIYELEKHYGVANKYLARFVDQIFNAFEIGEFKVKENHVGVCVRSAIWQVPRLNTNEVTRVLVLGGSQGSKILDETILEMSDYFRDNKIELWHQCRNESLEWLKIGYASRGLEVKLESFIKNPEIAYSWAHLVISRSGVGTINELKIVGRPAIFIPLKFASEQKENAQTMQDAGLARTVAEDADLEVNLKKILDNRNQFLNDYLAHFQNSDNSNATKKIVNLIYN